MKITALWIATAVLATYAGPSTSRSLTFSTGQLYELCRDARTSEEGGSISGDLVICIAYISGFSGRNSVLSTTGGINQKVFCPPRAQDPVLLMARTFYKWADENPQYHQLQGHIGLAKALATAYPCPKS